MSGFAGPEKKPDDVTKVPGKASGVTAGDFVAGDPASIQPGKRNLVQGWDTGVAYADKGAACEADPTKPGCFMTDRQRDHFDTLIVKRITDAQTNYKLALVEIKVEKLVSQEDDIPWVLGLALDLAGAHFATSFAKTLIRLKSVPVTDAMAFGFDETPDVGALAKALGRVSDSGIQSAAKKSFDVAGKQTKKALKASKKEAAKTEKVEALSYIEQLKVQCDVAFDKFTTNILANADDAQRVVIYNGLAPELHAEPIYKAELEAKLTRYHKAGVGQIGNEIQQVSSSRYNPEYYKSRRCVWIKAPNGDKSLWFYTVSGFNKENPWAEGKNPEMEQVPAEFVEAAISLSEEKWGSTPMFMNPAHAFQHSGTTPRLQLGSAAPNQAPKP